MWPPVVRQEHTHNMKGESLMPKTQDVATLDERSVQKIARGETVQAKPRRGRGKSKNGRIEEIFSLQALDNRVRAKIESLVDDVRNVQVLSPTDVVIWNHPAPWPGVRQ
jgi:hypothetical protein